MRSLQNGFIALVSLVSQFVAGSLSDKQGLHTNCCIHLYGNASAGLVIHLGWTLNAPCLVLVAKTKQKKYSCIFATPKPTNGVNGRPTAGNRGPIAPAWLPSLDLLPFGGLQGAVIPIMWCPFTLFGQLPTGQIAAQQTEAPVAVVAYPSYFPLLWPSITELDMAQRAELYFGLGGPSSVLPFLLLSRVTNIGLERGSLFA